MSFLLLAKNDVLNRWLVDGKTRLVTYKEWNDLIQGSFEHCFYVPSGTSPYYDHTHPV